MWDCLVSKTTIKTIIIIYLIILWTGNKTIISNVLAKQTQQPKTVKILNLHTGIQRLPF